MGKMPPVCKFWLEGSCRFAERCRFEHPVNRGGSFVNGNNRFGALADSNPNSNSRNNSSYQSGSSSSNQTLPYQLDKNAILTDLTNERPQWILSAYGPGRFAPAQLFGGPLREQSFEEMRLLHYVGLAAGNPQQVVHEAEALVQQSEQQMQTTINNIDSAIQYLINAEKEHPNRIDIVKAGQAEPGSQPNPFGGSTTPFGATPATAFGAQSQPSTTTAFGAPSTGAFGKPSQLGQKPNPFGASTPAFGAPSQLGTAGAFGQPSQLGNTGVFGQPSQLGNTGAFSQPSQLRTGGTFGQPAQLGQKPNPFGASSGGGFSSLGGGASVFGQPATSTAFGAPSQPAVSNPFTSSIQLIWRTVATGNIQSFRSTSLEEMEAKQHLHTSSINQQCPTPFSTPSQPAVSNSFGAPSQPATSSPFGAPSQPAVSSPFGAPSQPAQVNPFAQKPPSNSNPFGAPSQPAQPNPFGAPSAVPNNPPFGAPPQPGFPPAFGQPTPTNPNTFGQPQPTPRTAFSSFGRPPPAGQSAANPPPAFGAPRPPQASKGHSGQTGMNGFTKGVSSGQTDISAYSTRDTNGRLLAFKGNRVIYNKDNIPGFTNRAGKWEKIWFPNGPPAHDPQAYLSADRYNQMTKDAYEYARQNGRFKDGIMPTMPPIQEMCHWDF
ncbi:uncharacterized protein PAC_07425 [Phialocephala subalpina]|uniref:C3H1-type domain-containing protein n=1 Tax=Phialocephala subalpina TaxID=576137 RepID=A0A1L7WXP3_9HELO|nr:uncharacterized protein PAC_07425 [Phialocephala subalpina]